MRRLLPFVVFVVVVLGAYAGTTMIADARAQSADHLDGGDRGKEISSFVSSGKTIGPPVLTTEQRTNLQLRVLIYRNAQLELEAVVKDLTKPGFTLDLNTLRYVPSSEGKAVTP